MLTEQGGIAAGRAVETEDGYVLTLRQRIWDHYATSIAQVQTAAKHRAALQEYSLAAWNPLSATAATTAYLVEEDGSDYVQDFLNMMVLNGVEIERTTEVLSGASLALRDGLTEDREHPAGSYIIPTEQARHLFVNSIMSTDLAIEDSVMYDMSTWAAPLAYNLEAYTFAGPVTVDTKPYRAPLTTGRVATGSPTSAAYAYVIDWKQRHAPAALAACWKAGLRVRIANEPFTDDAGNTYSGGSIIALAGRNLEQIDQLDSLMETVARTTDVRVQAMGTGRMASGNDLASTRNFPVSQPRVALMVDEPFDTYTSGQVYFLFDQETQLPVTRIRTSILRQTSVPKFGSRYGYAELNDYDVLILPDADNLEAVFDTDARGVLKQWVQAGGTLVLVGSSAEFFTEDRKFNDQRLLTPAKDTSARAASLTFAERTDYYGKKNVPGSAMRATIDTTSPLGYGLKPEVYTLKFGNTALAPMADLQSVGRYASDSTALLAGGYADGQSLGNLAGNTWAGVRTLGRGQVVYLLDNPHYRMFWRGPSRLMQNAVMIVPGR